MAMKFDLVLLSVLLVLSSCCVLVSALEATSGMNVVFAQLVHRHGARTPTDIHSDHDAACGSLGCGILTSEGKDMLFKLGLWARNRYMLLPNTTSASTAYISNYSFYYPKRIVQRSTDKSRTLQSAAAFLQGLFNRDESSFYPSVDTVPLDTDSMLYVDAIPAAYINHDVHKAKEDADFNANFLLPAISSSDWIAMGVELLLTKPCSSSQTTWMDCYREVYDVAESYASMGTLSNYPLTASLYTTLQWLTFSYHTSLYTFNASLHTDRHRGPLGRNIVSEIVSQIDAFLNGTQEAYFREYSSEDTTLCVMSDTLGQSQYQLPQYGNAWFVELLQDGSNPASYYIRIMHGSPVQTPGDHAYTMQAFNLTCMASGGAIYNAGEEGCPLGDFVAWYNTQTGTSSEGLCYLRPDVRDAIHCDDTGSDKLPKKHCAWYRMMCPQWACPSGYYLEFPNLTCAAI